MDIDRKTGRQTDSHSKRRNGEREKEELAAVTDDDEPNDR